MIKVVISEEKESEQVEVKGAEEEALVGKKIGDTFAGKEIGKEGYTLKITGGTDKDGFPMRKDLEGTSRKKVLLSGGEGFNPTEEGERRRKTVRGNTVDKDIVQVNLKVVGKEG